MRTQWIERFNTTIARKPSKPGVWRRQEGGFVIRARVRDPRTGKDREIRRILPYATLEQAVAALKTEKQAIAAGTPEQEPLKIRLRDYAELLVQKKIQTGQIRSAASRHRWKVDLKRINAKLGDLYMSEIRRSDLLAFHEHLATLATQGTYAPITCMTLMKTLKVVVRAYAREHGLPEPASGIPGFDLSLRRTYTREQPNSLRPGEAQWFIAQVAQSYPQFLTMVTLGFALGLRPSSLRALHKVDVLWTDGGWLLNRRSHTLRQEIMERTKIGKDTEIPLTPDLLAMLRNHLDTQPAGPMRDSPLLFPNKDGKVYSPDVLWYVFKQIRSGAALDKKIIPRGMRRTSKDLLRLSEASQVVAMAINGHHTEQMHHHYSTVHEVEIREVIGKTTQLMGLAPLLRTGGEKSGVKGPAVASETFASRRCGALTDTESEEAARVLGPYPQDGQWRVIEIDARGRRKSYIADSRQAANRLIAKLRAYQDSRTVEVTLDLWTEARLRAGKAAPATIAEQAARIRTMLQPVFSLRLDEVTERKAVALYERITREPSKTTGRPLQPATHHFYLSIVETMWRWAQKQGFAQHNPWAEVEPVGRVAAGKPQLRPVEARRFAQVAAEQAEAGSGVALAALCCLSLGLRASEALGLTARDVDAEAGEVYVNGTKTVGSRRRLKVSAHLAGLLACAAAGRQPTERLCAASRQALHKAVVKLCERAGLPRVCVHGLRGTHASLAVSGGASVEAVARVLGHTSTKMTLSHYITEEAATGARLTAVESFLRPSQSFREGFMHPISDEKIAPPSLLALSPPRPPQPAIDQTTTAT